MATAEKLKVISGGKEVGTKAWADRLRKRAKDLVVELETGYMELAEILYNLFDRPVNGDKNNHAWITEWGYKGIGEFAEQELGLYKRKAEYLRAIWYRLEVELEGMDPEIKKRIVALGWSKVREMIRVLTLRNAKKWVELGEQLSFHDLEEAVKKYRQEVEAYNEAKKHGEKIKPPIPSKVEKDKDFPHAFKGMLKLAQPPQSIPEEVEDEPELPPPIADKTIQRIFAFYPEQLELVEAAIVRAAELSGSPVRSNNLALVCQDFLATNTFKKADTDQIIRFLAKYEKLMNVRLVILDEDDDPIYGITHLEEIADKLGLGKKGK